MAVAGPPLKIVTCELLLSALHDFASPEGPDISFNQIKSRVEYRVGREDQASSEEVLYDGFTSEMSKAAGHAVLQRFNTLAQSFAHPSADVQMLALEFRGENVAKALAMARSREPVLKEAYRHAFGDAFNTHERVASKAVNVTMSLTTAGAVGMLAFDPSILTLGVVLLNTSLWFLPATVSGQSMKHLLDRHDWQHRLVTESLERMIQGPADDRFLVVGNNMELPPEYHRMLMSYTPTQNAVNNGRAAGVRALGSGLTLKCISKMNAAEAIDRQHRVHLDHIVFFDGSTMEPVWIVIYRASCPRSSGSAPATNRIKAAAEPRWVPQLVPVSRSEN